MSGEVYLNHGIYQPQAEAILVVPKYAITLEKAQIAGGTDTVMLKLRLRKVKLVRNDHFHADTLSITAEWNDAGVDPRFLKHATIQLWMGDVRSSIGLGPVQFTGIAKRVSRAAKDGDGLSVDMDFHDYTTMFINSKPYPNDGVPSFDDTLRTAWGKICDNTGWKDTNGGKIVSNVTALKTQIKTRVPGALDVPIGKAVAARIQKLGKFIGNATESTSSWDVWQHAVQALGFITFIDGDECIVTDTTEHFSQDDAPTFIWGQNILSVSEQCNVDVSNHGVALQSWEPLEGKVVESYYPPPGDSRIYVSRGAAKSKYFDPKDVVSGQYDFFPYHDVTDQETLDAVCKAAYEERIRQEIEGNLVTHEMELFTAKGDVARMLELRAGDSISVRIDDANRGLLGKLQGEQERIEFLVSPQGGYHSRDAAELILRNLDAIGAFKPIFHVKSCSVSLDGDKYECEIEYHNLINLSDVAADRADVIVDGSEIKAQLDAQFAQSPTADKANSETGKSPEINTTEIDGGY